MNNENNNTVCFPIDQMDWTRLISNRNQLVELSNIMDEKYNDALNTAIAIIEQLLIYQDYGKTLDQLQESHLVLQEPHPD